MIPSTSPITPTRPPQTAIPPKDAAQKTKELINERFKDEVSRQEATAALNSPLLKEAFVEVADSAFGEEFLTYFSRPATEQEISQLTETFKLPESAAKTRELLRCRLNGAFTDEGAQRLNAAFREALLKQYEKALPRTALFSQGSYKLSPTANHQPRPADAQISHIILHHTALKSVDDAIAYMNTHTLSAHDVIDRDGSLTCLVPETYQAWHAGVSNWDNLRLMNQYSIGIELDNNGAEPFPDEQINQLLVRLRGLTDHYSIPAENVIAHADIAPGRKFDPSHLFPWDKLAEHGFGLYPKRGEQPTSVPADFNIIDGLYELGYRVDARKSKEENIAAISKEKKKEELLQAFNQKYLRKPNQSTLDDEGKHILYQLVEQKKASQQAQQQAQAFV